MKEILIRKAGKSDLQDIQRLLSTYFLDMEGLKAEDFFVAEIDGQIRGCAALIMSGSQGKRFLELIHCCPSQLSGKRYRNQAC